VNSDHATVGTLAWVQRTGGRLTSAERRALLLPLARSHVQIAVGRLRLALRVHPGRHADVPPARLIPPVSVLTRAAEDLAGHILPAPLLHHSHRAYRFGRALGELEGVDVDTELLFAAALLHDTGLVDPPTDADFTLSSARHARGVAEQVGLSTTESEVLETAITMHYNPGVTLSHGPVAYLLAAGAAVDVVGLRFWELPAQTIADALDEHPRADFRSTFAPAFREEAARVPDGRARFLYRYGAFGAAIKLAPFED